MKDCRDCKYFAGWDDSDGTPYCEYEKGIENCPYDNETEIKNNGVKIEVDTGFMQDYIYHTLKNTTEREIRAIAQEEIESIITEELKDKILEDMRAQIKDVVSNSISETIEDELKDRFKKSRTDEEI